MINTIKKNCPHIESSNLINLEKFQQIPFENLNCKKCDEKKELWICLICGECFCSKKVKGHFIEHHNENENHLLFISLLDLKIWCNECLDDNKDNSDSKDKGCYIESNITKGYIEIIEKFKLGKGEEEQKSSEKEENKKDKEEQIENNLILDNKKEICSHIKDEEIINHFKDYLDTYFHTGFKILMNHKDNLIYTGLCLICGDRVDDSENLKHHYNTQNHKLYFNLLDFTVVCMECKSKYDFALMNDFKKYRILFQYLFEKNIILPKEVELLTKEEIFDMKYQKFVKDFIDKKFSKILFMVGAGISTSAGIPDFRSNTGLFKQLQEKYNLSSPEQFFEKSTFLKNPMYFYEFTKLFDLSKVNPTISHKFMNFFVNKNIVKYIFTQNIDGLEKKAKIPDEKLIFAHGNFYTGHCANCNCSIDIEKINEGIEKGEIYYCPKCGGPCKPNVVFYGEGLPMRFFEKLQESKDVDLIIIMGTSLKVNPFKSIPYLVNQNAYKLVLNWEEVGEFGYNYLEDDSIFIQGKTDKSIIRILNDINLYKEFEEFIKNEYNEKLDDIIDKENELINVNSNKKEEDKKVEKITKEVEKINLNVDK